MFGIGKFETDLKELVYELREIRYSMQAIRSELGELREDIKKISKERDVPELEKGETL